MNKFADNREKFNYYVLKSEWYRKKGDLANSLLCYEKAKEVKKMLDEEEKKAN